MTPANQTLTLETFLRLPNIEESPAWEFINGKMLQKLMPTSHHSILQKRLVAAIDKAKSKYEAFPELRCILSQQSVVPDITVILSSRLPSENGPVEGAPDWAIEILSPDQSTMKLIAKLQTCLAEGTQLGWLLDPTEEVIMVLFYDRPLAIIDDGIVPVLPGIELSLTAKQIFGWLKPRSG